MELMALVCSLVMGLCVAGAAYFGGTAFHGLVDRIERDLGERLRTLRMPTKRLRRWIYLWLGVLAALFFALWLGADALTFAACGVALLSAGPWYLVRRMAQQRRQKIEDQLADAMVMFSGAIRAGLSIPQALEILAVECPVPIRQEFAQLVGEYRLGRPLEKTLEEGKSRLKSENFVLFAAALLASRESGGRLNETVERISKSILEIQRLERKIISETAQARKSALYMAAAPALILAVYFYIDPVNTRMLFVTLPGQIMLSAAVVLNLVAYGWARVILNPEI
ncbi:MAG: type II secretion system F family protein [Pirellulaceae bacterium]|nr:type II secretion system F family protein [Pirellulaceae bacterium]